MHFQSRISNMIRDPVCKSVIFQYLCHTGSSLAEEFKFNYKPDKNMEVNLEKLLRDWREEKEEIKMIIYQYLRKTSSLDLAGGGSPKGDNVAFSRQEVLQSDDLLCGGG